MQSFAAPEHAPREHRQTQSVEEMQNTNTEQHPVVGAAPVASPAATPIPVSAAPQPAAGAVPAAATPVPAGAAPAGAAPAGAMPASAAQRGSTAAGKAIVAINVFQILEVLFIVVLLLLNFGGKLVGYETYSIKSGSMEPTIPKGSLVYVDTNDTIPEVGEVVSFYAGESVVSHRAIAIDEEQQKVTTRGDANENPDISPIKYSDIIGICRYSVPKLGDWFVWIAENKYPLVGALIGFNLLLWILEYVLKARTEREDSDGIETT